MIKLNEFKLTGRLTADPELKCTTAGKPYVQIGVAVQKSVKVSDQWQDSVFFINTTLWGEQTERFCKYGKKGSPVYLEGRIDVVEKDGKKYTMLVPSSFQLEYTKTDKVEGEPEQTPITDDDVPF
ncbi:MAG: single-stranded DNA-binding protein [Crenarchaeota archaeon]|nr:single-stranded DNA-binding protein [Thermoproteota archaeon]